MTSCADGEACRLTWPHERAVITRNTRNVAQNGHSHPWTGSRREAVLKTPGRLQRRRPKINICCRLTISPRPGHAFDQARRRHREGASAGMVPYACEDRPSRKGPPCPTPLSAPVQTPPVVPPSPRDGQLAQVFRFGSCPSLRSVPPSLRRRPLCSSDDVSFPRFSFYTIRSLPDSDDHNIILPRNYRILSAAFSTFINKCRSSLVLIAFDYLALCHHPSSVLCVT